MFKKLLLVSTISSLLIVGSVNAADYKIDTEGNHAFINFRISHLGYSWLYGTFKDFSGSFTFDEANPAADKVMVTINTASLDTNHVERDKHLKSADFLNVAAHPNASFISDKVIATTGNKFVIEGNLTLNGVIKPITINAEKVGEGKDPWGGYRAGFYGTTILNLTDFNIDTSKLGPTAKQVEMTLAIEGIRQ